MSKSGRKSSVWVWATYFVLVPISFLLAAGCRTAIQNQHSQRCVDTALRSNESVPGGSKVISWLFRSLRCLFYRPTNSKRLTSLIKIRYTRSGTFLVFDWRNVVKFQPISANFSQFESFSSYFGHFLTKLSRF